MTFTTALAEILRRDLTRLLQELDGFSDEQTLWKTAPGITNSAGNLFLHLEGNLREFVGRQLGGVDYTRRRDEEFSLTGVPAAELKRRLTGVRDLIPGIVAAVTDERLAVEFPHKVNGATMPTQQFLLHLSGHLCYHLGQIDYARRFFTGNGAIDLAGF